MLKPERRAVFSFRTTTAAMQAEGLARQAGLPGRLIPLPPAISAGCGLCYAAPPEAAGDLRVLFAPIPPQGEYELEF